jgi:ectoine hydroxylase-related dioxygenase (phytanoyl-CoA dioxygenase family)
MTESTQWLTAAQVAQYDTEGYVVVDNLIDAATAREWKEILKTRLTAEGKIGEPSGVRVWMADAMDDFTRDQVTSAKIAAILQQLIGPNVEFLSVKAVFKNATTTFNSPWHQDWFYWQGAPKLSIWLALDDATPENGCLRLVPGSHREHFTPRNIDDGHGFGLRIADEDLAGRPEVTVPVARGSAVIFHDLALHSSCPNLNGQDRWSAIATYRDAGVRDASTVWKGGLVMSGASGNGDAD